MFTPLELALLSCLLLGFRHGFDYDHLAAITDITSVQRGWKEGMRLGLLYALGHALTVAVLGVVSSFCTSRCLNTLTPWANALVGATLIVLAIYVFASLWRHRKHLPHGPQAHSHTVARSRIAMLVSGSRYLWWSIRRFTQPSLPKPDPFAFRYDRGSVFTVGIIHGLGAETPSQLLLFLLAANLGGTSRGLIGLLAFIAGLLVMNTLMTASASGIFAGSRTRSRLQAAVTSITAIYSLAIGTIFLFGLSDRLPALVR